MANLTQLNFISTENYLKRGAELTGSGTLALDSGGGTTTYTVTHNLGYVPFYTIGAELTQDGMIWCNEIVDQYTQTLASGSPSDYPVLRAWATEDELTIALFNNTLPIQTGDIPIYWAIYLDYSQ
jgi:hypothetical protein